MKWKNEMQERMGEHRKGDILREKKINPKAKTTTKEGARKLLNAS
jgi:hypothetical protein